MEKYRRKLELKINGEKKKVMVIDSKRDKSEHRWYNGEGERV